ncbi:MAG: hypothetical protein IKG11_09905 [Atopobiaceae bacterium]|nr:hypothetical protein [Atopobiaceae bacterium]
MSRFARAALGSSSAWLLAALTIRLARAALGSSAIAKATGTDFDSLPLDAVEEGTPEDPVEEAAATAMKSEEILELINSADPAVKEAALAVLKGKAQQGVDLIGSILPVISQLLGSNKTVGDLIPVIIGFLGSKDGAAFMETIKSAIGNIAGMLGGIGSGDGEGRGVRKVSDSFLAFTFFYSVAIFVLVIGFHYMQVHRAELHDGTVVAVKVRRPGVVDTVARDFALLESILDTCVRNNLGESTSKA